MGGRASAAIGRKLLAAALIVAGSTCSRPTLDSRMIVPVAIVTIAPTSVSLAVDQTLRLTATLGDAAGNMLPGRVAAPTLVQGPTQELANVIGDAEGRTGRIVTWRSSEPSRVRVNERGLVTGLAAGVVTITATSEGRHGTSTVIVTDPLNAPVSVTPVRATLSAGESLQLTATTPKQDAGELQAPMTWSSDHPSRATVTATGLVTAIAPGTTTITATTAGKRASAALTITPVKTIYGLDFPGNAGVNTTMRFEFVPPLPAFPATYIWRVYPRQQQSYYTAFFWGNNGAFFGSHTYYGFHPYPDFDTQRQHFWEIAAPPGGDFVSSSHVAYDQWYIQVAICDESGSATLHEFYWDWPDPTRVLQHTATKYSDPPTPGLVVGDAPWNQGHEVWDGILRGFQFYDVALTQSEIAQEIASPGSVRTPWYLNLDPTPTDVSDKSGTGHHPTWVGTERPSRWMGKVGNGGVIRTTVPPR
jgi:hypothetical protein